MLAELSVPFGQGYWLGRPQPLLRWIPHVPPSPNGEAAPARLSRWCGGSGSSSITWVSGKVRGALRTGQLQHRLSCVPVGQRAAFRQVGTVTDCRCDDGSVADAVRGNWPAGRRMGPRCKSSLRHHRDRSLSADCVIQ